MKNKTLSHGTSFYYIGPSLHFYVYIKNIAFCDDRCTLKVYRATASNTWSLINSWSLDGNKSGAFKINYPRVGSHTTNNYYSDSCRFKVTFEVPYGDNRVEASTIQSGVSNAGHTEIYDSYFKGHKIYRWSRLIGCVYALTTTYYAPSQIATCLTGSSLLAANAACTWPLLNY